MQMGNEGAKRNNTDLFLLLYIAGLPLNHITIPRIGSAYKIIVFVVALYYGIQLIHRKNGKLFFDRAIATWFLLTVYGGITVFWAEDYSRSSSQIVSLIEIFVVTVLILNQTYSRSTRNRIENAILFTGVVYLIFITFFSHDQIYTARKMISFGAYGSMDPNEWCGYMVAPTAVAITRIYDQRSLKSKLAYIVYLLLIVFWSIMGGSRGGMLAVLITIAYVVIRNSIASIHTIVLTVFVGLIAIISLYSFLLPRIPATVLQRFTMDGMTQYGGAGGRGIRWTSILSYIGSNFRVLLLGNGLYGATSVAYVAHNQFLQILLDLGIIGLSIFIVLTRQLFKAARNKALFEMASLIGIYVALMSLTAYGWFKAVWVIYMLCLIRYEDEENSTDERETNSLSGHF